MNIIVFDPSCRNQDGLPSINLGDLIIRDACDQVWQELFPGVTPMRIATHALPLPGQLSAATDADLVLVAGTNLFSSDILAYDQWKLLSDPLDYADPPRLDAVTCGVGWWQYQQSPPLLTRHYYSRLLHPDCPQSVRDSYTAGRLAACGVPRVFNTSCPTMWRLDGRETGRPSGNKRCLFCLTDYASSPERDDHLVRQLAALYPDGLVYFPQGDHDLVYASSLPAFTELAAYITVLPHDYESFLELLNQGQGLDYVGTRLHAGVWCLEHHLPTLILAVDNRAAEIGRDTGLPVIARGDEAALDRWHSGASRGVIRLPGDAIAAWKEAVHEAALAKRSGRSQAAPPLPPGRLLNLGCGGRVHPDWVNVDQTATRSGVLAHDLTRPLPFAQGAFDAVYASHVLEHFSKDQAGSFLDECRRLLRPGGILRLVVPDLEWLARRYLLALEAADASGDPEAEARHDYAVVNLVDQLSRHEPGGEMLRFWKRAPLPAEDYILETNGLEVLRALIAIRLAPPEAPSPAAPEPPSQAPGPWWRRLLRLPAPAELPDRPTPDDGEPAVGRFRLSGEPHLWMYDRASLTRLLAAKGFSSITRRRADVSGIAGFARFGLDADTRGLPYKPESLFIEATR